VRAVTRKRLAAALPSLTIAGLAVAYVWISYDYAFGSRAMPWIAGFLALILAVGDAAMRWPAGAGAGSAGAPPVPLAQELRMFGWMAGFLVLVVVLGFYAAIPFYLFCYLRLRAGKGALVAAATGFGLAAFLYIVFELLMGYEIFSGLLAGDYL
jgi:hypothetical protein